MRNIILLLVLLLLPSLSFANGGRSGWLGGLYGIEKVDSSEYDLMGGNLGFLFSPQVGVGGFYLKSKEKTGRVGTILTSTKQTMYGLDIKYFIDAGRIIHIGLKAGLSEFTGTVALLNVSTPFTTEQKVIGPTVGLDLPLTNFFSIGGEASYLYYTGDSSNDSGYLALGSAKIWF